MPDEPTSNQQERENLTTSVEATVARVLTAMQSTGSLTQVQLDIADTELTAIKAEIVALAPEAPVVVSPTPVATVKV